jgi:hypothetical protein
LSAREHRDRFKNPAHHASLQDNERRKMRPGLEGSPSSSGAPFDNAISPWRSIAIT